VTATREIVDSPIGPWSVEGDDDGLTHISTPRELSGSASERPSRVVRDAARQLAEYFAGKRRDFDLDLHTTGTEFQIDVWVALCAIPYGQVRTYGEIAGVVGRPSAYRAVGNANGRNLLPVVIPCHRVVASNGIGGYGSGLDVKRFLLSIEGVSL
jgi:methylated-DNA-[protein]-cysteine S-methyltransferase